MKLRIGHFVGFFGTWLLVQHGHCATITTTATAETKATFGSPIPDCSVTDSGFAVCQTNGAGAQSTASGWFDEQHSLGGISIQTNADRLNGFENAVASATASMDAWFMPATTETITAHFGYGLGPSWGWPPMLQILLNGVTASPRGSGEVFLSTQVTAGVAFEVLLSLSDRVSAPEGAGGGYVQLAGFADAQGNRLILADPPGPSSVPEPGTAWLLVAPLGYVLGRRVMRGLGGQDERRAP